MIAILWRFEIRPEARRAFERAYGPGGDWAVLFRRGEGYLGTELLRGDGDTYLTVDRWHGQADFDAFMAVHRADYEALDAATQGWTLEERSIGVFETPGEMEGG